MKSIPTAAIADVSLDEIAQAPDPQYEYVNGKKILVSRIEEYFRATFYKPVPHSSEHSLLEHKNNFKRRIQANPRLALKIVATPIGKLFGRYIGFPKPTASEHYLAGLLIIFTTFTAFAVITMLRRSRYPILGPLCLILSIFLFMEVVRESGFFLIRLLSPMAIIVVIWATWKSLQAYAFSPRI